MKRNLLKVVGTLLAMVAFASVSSACSWLIYQPKTPKSLR